MGITLRIALQSESLLVEAEGVFSIAEAERSFLEILDALARNKVAKVLFDGRALKGRPGLMERFVYGTFVAEAVVEFVHRRKWVNPEFAYVLLEPVADRGRFGETVAVNRGMRVKVFHQLADARAWLGIPPAD